MEILDDNWVQHILQQNDDDDDDIHNEDATPPPLASPIESSTVESSAVESSAVESSAIESSSIESSAIESSPIESSAIESSASIDPSYISPPIESFTPRPNDYDTDEEYTQNKDESDSESEEDDDIDKWTQPEYPTYIHLYFMYVTRDNTIKKIINEKINLSEKGILQKELLFYLIESKKKKNYKLQTMLLYQNTIDDIHGTFEEKLENDTFLKLLPIIDTVQFHEHIPLFHSLNALYIMLCENTGETEIINGRKTFKRVPYKKYTRRIKYYSTHGGNDPQTHMTLKDNAKKTCKKVSFVAP